MYLINESVRRLHPRECARLMGFPESFQLHDRRNVSYKHFGNSVAIPVVAKIFKEIQKKFVGSSFESSLSIQKMQLAKRSAKNTFGCLIGCAIGDLGAILCFQNYFAPESIPKELWNLVWGVAMASGITTSIILETLILWRQLGHEGSFSHGDRHESDLNDFNGGRYEFG